MKYKKIFRILVMAAILSLLVLALPASPVLAYSEDIELDPAEGEIGDRIDIYGEDFEESYYNSDTDYYDSYVDIYFSSEEADEGDEIDDEVENYERVKSGVLVDEDGEFDTYFDVPDELTDGADDEDVQGGTYYVYVTYEDDDIVAVAEFTVISGEIELDTDEGPVGTEVEITGTGFGDREEITVEFDGDYIDIESGDDETDSDGEFECTIIIPESEAGDHTITVSDDAGSEAEATFTVEPEITLDPTSGSPDTLVTVSGTGFESRETITITFAGDEVATNDSDSDGSFGAFFNVPADNAGSYRVEADDGDNDAEAVFVVTIVASLSLSPTTGNVGTQLTVSGTGFTAGKTVSIKYDTTEIATAPVDANRTFSVTFNAPISKYGEHIVIATDDTFTEQSTFTMESTPPPVPSPLLPEMGVKTEAPIRFDWMDVDDPSGVTYTLQVASDKDFDSIVLEKKGLTKSEYTLTITEELAPTEKETPYYWRVRAIDGASNESQWTGTGQFYIGFAFAMPSWALYAFIGIGGLLLLALVYRLGKRSAS